MMMCFRINLQKPQKRILQLNTVIFHLCLSLIIVPNSIRGQSNFVLTPTLDSAHRALLTLQLSKSDEFLSLSQSTEPHNLLVLLFENTRDCLELALREDKSKYLKLLPQRKKRLAIINQSDASPSPWKRFILAEIRLHWAAVKLIFGEHLSAFLELSKAHRLLTENSNKYPNFILNQRSLAVLDIIAGAIPQEYHWVVRWFSPLTPNTNGGLTAMNQLLEASEWPSQHFFEETALLYLHLLHSLADDPEKAWIKSTQIRLSPNSNPLHCFILASVAKQAGQPEETLFLLANRPDSLSHDPFPQLDLLHGETLLQNLKPNADFYLNRFIKQFAGQNSVPATYQKLAWYYLLQRDTHSFLNYRELCLSITSPHGEIDQYAHLAALSTTIPNMYLLKSRLLFDAGQYHKALEILEEIQNPNLLEPIEYLEYFYRLARIHHKRKDYPKAIECYQSTIELGNAEDLHFACNSALQLGRIFQKIGYPEKARAYLTLCLSMHPALFKNSIHRKAKFTLNQL